jgi:Glycosyltransferase 61
MSDVKMNKTNINDILQFSELPNLRYPDNIIDSDKNTFFETFLSKVIPNMEIKTLNNVSISPHGTIYKKFSILKECTPFYFAPDHEYFPTFMEKHINAGGRFLNGSIERFIRHFIVFKKTNIRETHFWCSDQYSPGYFHWLCETLPRLYLLTLLEIDRPKVILPGPTMENVPFIRESLNLLFPGIDFSFTKNQNVLNLRELIWISPMGDHRQFNPILISRFREFIKNIVKTERTHPLQRLYITRKKASVRKISNEAEVESILERFGFRTICLEDYSFEDHIKIFSQSKVIISVHGAGLSNMIFMPENSCVLELQRRMPEATAYSALANCLNFNYYYIFCEPATELVDERPDNVDLYVDVNSMQRLVETMLIDSELKNESIFN